MELVDSMNDVHFFRNVHVILHRYVCLIKIHVKARLLTACCLRSLVASLCEMLSLLIVSGAGPALSWYVTFLCEMPSLH